MIFSIMLSGNSLNFYLIILKAAFLEYHAKHYVTVSEKICLLKELLSGDCFIRISGCSIRVSQYLMVALYEMDQQPNSTYY